MAEFNIINFENFMSGCKCVLDNATWDLMKWKRYYKPQCITDYQLRELDKKEAAGDLIKWEDYFKQEGISLEGVSIEHLESLDKREAENKALWARKSFYATGVFKTPQKSWSDNGNKIYVDAHRSKSHLKHIILMDERMNVKSHVQKELSKLCKRIDEFSHTHNIENCNIYPKNHWYRKLKYVVFEFKHWFEETFDEVQNNVLPDSPTKLLPSTFKEIFAIPEWKPYLDVLTENEKPILLKDGDTWKIGYRSKGALLNYFGDLQHDTIVNGTREAICNVLFTQIKGFDKKPDISSLTKPSQGYMTFKKKLKRNINLFPKGEFGKL